MYLLRRHFGISAYEAEHVLPEWEVDLLLRGLRQEFAPPETVPMPRGMPRDPWAEVPAELERLRLSDGP